MYSSGRNALAVCDRCGFAYPYSSIISEPGTGWRVCSTCNDGQYSLVSHPQNSPTIPIEESQGLEHPRPDAPFVVPVSLSLP